MTLDKSNMLASHFDCVVMLTFSNWKTEPRSNRYHYASRFAKQLPVIFVQPDLRAAKTKYEKTEVEGVSILHVYSRYGTMQNKLINRAILEKGFSKPLLWVYNPHFSGFVAHRFSPFAIFHATEDFYSPDFKGHGEFINSLHQLLEQIDLLVAVSDEVLQSYIGKNVGHTWQTLLLPNGCDYKFWAPSKGEVDQIVSQHEGKKVVFYQGGLNWRLDWSLIEGISRALPDWEVWLCGKILFESTKDLHSLRSPNIKKFGYLDSEHIRALAHQATVGIIPFRQLDIIQESLPLKAFEYIACGLPVVSVPIKALQPYGDIFEFAKTVQEFVDVIRRVAPSRYDIAAIDRRLKVAAEQDYDTRFNELVQKVDFEMSKKKPESLPLNVLILYDAHSIHINTIREHLQSFATFSVSKVFYSYATQDQKCAIDLEAFDVIIIHYCIRLSLDWHFSQSFAEALRHFGGYKVLFIQDEYDTTETARKWIGSLGINAVFTCVPEAFVDLIYPSSRFPYLERIQTLTGYVPIGVENHKPKPISERKNVIGYRGRPLPYYYGDLCREKMIIAQRMKQICGERNISTDIEYANEKRIYGDQWYTFIEDCKATLGTESGSNVFDDYGIIKANVEDALKKAPTLTYEEVHAKYIGAEEGRIKMNQVSPRIFEAIAFRTALVLFEGTYSGVVEPEKHFIPLKKDFSNVNDVLAKLQDDQYLETLTDRAYRDIIASGKYSYQSFVSHFDKFLSTHVVRRSKAILLTGMIGAYEPNIKNLTVVDYKSQTRFRTALFISNLPLDVEQTTFKSNGMGLGKKHPEMINMLLSIKTRISNTLQSVPVLHQLAYRIYRGMVATYNRLSKNK